MVAIQRQTWFRFGYWILGTRLYSIHKLQAASSCTGKTRCLDTVHGPAGSDGLMSAQTGQTGHGFSMVFRDSSNSPGTGKWTLSKRSWAERNECKQCKQCKHSPNDSNYHINPINLQSISNPIFAATVSLQRSSKANRPGHIDCLKQIHSLTFSQVDESRRSGIMSIHGRRTRPWKYPTNLYESIS